MKNLKKIVLGLMILLAAFAFVGCPTPEQPSPTPDPEPTPAPVAPVNNFKGNVYVMSYEEEEEGLSFSWIIGYIEFTDDTNGKVVMLSENEETYEECLDEFPFTYTVEDDVATITQTIEGETESIETSKLVNNEFSIVDKETGSELKISCKKGDTSLFVKGNAYLDEKPMLEEEMFLASIVNYNELAEEDYVVKDGNLVLTDAYKEKINLWTLIAPGGLEASLPYDIIMEQFYMYGLEEDTHYTVDEDNLTITVNDDGFAIMNAPLWKIVNMEGLLQSQAPEFYVRVQIEEAGLIEGEDYTVNSEKRMFILTESGSEKWNEYYNS